METVWITLNTLVDGSEETERRTFMFGPTGIVGFRTVNDSTMLLSGNKAIALVADSQEDIMTILSKMRGTEGMYGKAKEKLAKTSSNTKAKSKSKKHSR